MKEVVLTGLVGFECAIHVNLLKKFGNLFLFNLMLVTDK
jgi:hypothetical protein